MSVSELLNPFLYPVHHVTGGFVTEIEPPNKLTPSERKKAWEKAAKSSASLRDLAVVAWDIEQRFNEQLGD